MNIITVPETQTPGLPFAVGNIYRNVNEQEYYILSLVNSSNDFVLIRLHDGNAWSTTRATMQQAFCDCEHEFELVQGKITIECNKQ